MTSIFLGGAVGSALTAVVWVRGGWAGVCGLGVTLSAGTVVLWVLERLTTRSGAREAAVREGQDRAPAGSAS